MIETGMTAADRTVITDLITDLEVKTAGKFVALTEDERSKYGSVNEQNKLLVNKTHDYQANSPAMSSPDVDWAEFESDYQTRLFLENCIQRLESIAYQMRSTKILHDHDNYQDALNDYAYAQYKKGAGEAGYAEKAAEMKQFFPKSKKVVPPGEGDNG